MGRYDVQSSTLYRASSVCVLYFQFLFAKIGGIYKFLKIR